MWLRFIAPMGGSANTDITSHEEPVPWQAFAFFETTLFSAPYMYDQRKIWIQSEYKHIRQDVTQA